MVRTPDILHLFLFYRLNVLMNCVERYKSLLWTSLKYVSSDLLLYSIVFYRYGTSQ